MIQSPGSEPQSEFIFAVKVSGGFAELVLHLAVVKKPEYLQNYHKV